AMSRDRSCPGPKVPSMYGKGECTILFARPNPLGCGQTMPDGRGQTMLDRAGGHPGDCRSRPPRPDHFHARETRAIHFDPVPNDTGLGFMCWLRYATTVKENRHAWHRTDGAASQPSPTRG